MKKTLLTLTIFAALVACNSGGDTKGGETKKSETADITQDPNYKTGLALVEKQDCFTCHKVDGELTGPSYKKVAEKYAGATDGQVTELAQTIIKGSRGKWGEAYMTPHPSISEDDAKAMVRYVLLLK
ncbi:MAG TPA: c-type cytochrome [Chitinophagaceae bacterium]|nr:c-type cytochrome [Chitinophagaceae bacterium]